MNNAIEFLKKRRSIYAIGKNIELNNEEITELIEGAVKNSPTAFNSQTVRAVIAFGESSDRVWDIVLDELRKVVKDDDALRRRKKNRNFQGRFGNGTVFYGNGNRQEIGKRFSALRRQFCRLGGTRHRRRTAGRLGSFGSNGLGASLQHYNPLIDDAIRQQFDLPESWRLRAEMPFGSIEAPAGDKKFLEDDVRFKVLTKIWFCDRETK